MAPQKLNPKSSNPPPQIEDLFSSLDDCIRNEKYRDAVKVADQILATAPGDEDAVISKIVALIKLDEIDKALTEIQGFKSLLLDLNYFKAYCLYRQNKLKEALNALDGQEKTPMVLQLETQIYYRLNKWDACMESFGKLKEFKVESDVKINIVAALVAAGRAEEVQGMMDTLKVKASSSFELAYNTACSLIDKGSYADAEQLLLSARRMGQEILIDESLEEDEIEADLAPINVQLAYVHQLMGNTQEAIEGYMSVINRKVADASTLAVATNNLIALKGTKDASDSLKKLNLRIEKTSGADSKLSQRQKEALYSNRVLLLLHTNKLDQAEELVYTLLEMFPDSVTPVLLQAAVHVREKKIPKAEEILGQFAVKFPEKSKPILLARAQIAAVASRYQIAADSLSKVTDIQHMPCTIATLVSLKERMGDIVGAVQVLDSAIDWWKNSMIEDNKLSLIMQEAAAFKLNHGFKQAASQLYEQLVKDEGSIEALVGLVTTAAQTDLEKAEMYEMKLKALPGLKGINVENLEKTHGANQGENAHVEKMEVSDEVKKARAKKRKRKPKYPKGFDPANPGPPPDPERWLPRRERSSYRPKRKDKRQIRGSQGAVAKDKHETTNATNAAASSNPKGGQANASVTKGGSKVAGSSEQQSKGSNKSRKKKSRN